MNYPPDCADCPSPEDCKRKNDCGVMRQIRHGHEKPSPACRVEAFLKQFAGHDRGVVISQPRPGRFEERPMTSSELAAREPAMKIAADIYRHASQAGVCYYETWRLIAEAIDRAAAPVDMLLFCPHCRRKHVDAPEPESGWTNPPHATHTCKFCGLNWRPSNALTNGVATIDCLEPKHAQRIANCFPTDPGAT